VNRQCRRQCPEICKTVVLNPVAPNSPPNPKQCLYPLESAGDHAVVCHTGPSLIARHNHVNWIWYSLLCTYGFDCKLEQRCNPSSQDRQADTLVYRWHNLTDYAHDWTITHVLRDRYVEALDRPCRQADPTSVCDPDLALIEAEQAKLSSVNLGPEHPAFLPLAADTFGGFGSLAWEAFKYLHSRIKAFQPSFTFTKLVQVLQIAVLRGVADQLLRRKVALSPEDNLVPAPKSLTFAQWKPVFSCDVPPAPPNSVATVSFPSSPSPSPAPRPLILPASKSPSSNPRLFPPAICSLFDDEGYCCFF